MHGVKAWDPPLIDPNFPSSGFGSMFSFGGSGGWFGFCDATALLGCVGFMLLSFTLVGMSTGTAIEIGKFEKSISLYSLSLSRLGASSSYGTVNAAGVCGIDY
jgi:hypothetical protein